MESKKIGLPKSKISDFVSNYYDFAFLNNNAIFRFRWQQTADDFGLLQKQIYQALDWLTQLWLPDYLTVQLVPFEYGVPSLDNLKILTVEGSADSPEALMKNLKETIAKELADLNSGTSNEIWFVNSLGPSIEGWVRLALPEEINLADKWTFVTEDGVYPADYAVREAPKLQQFNTMWVKLYDANSSSDLSIFVNSATEVEVRLTLGSTLFNPSNDPRHRGIAIHDSSLGLWQNTNLELLEFIFEKLKQAGWSVT